MKKTILLLSSTLIIVLISACSGNEGGSENAKISDSKDSLSYALGINIGNDFKNQDIPINTELFAKGVADGFKGECLFADSVIGVLLNDFQSELNLKIEEKKAGMLEKNKQDGANFLAENNKREGVITLPAGMQYKIIREGKGNTPSPGDSVMIHYRAMFIDGTTFDQSYDRGLTGIRLNNVIQGLSEGIQMMKPGSVYELYIPPDLGYGDEDFANIIPGGSTLVYRIELVDIVD